MLAGVDGLAGRVRLVSGRLPRGCDEERCEVLAGRGRAACPRALELYDVPLRGRRDAAGSTRVPLGPLPPPAGLDRRGARRSWSPTASRRCSSIQALDVVPRTFTWTRVLDPAAVHPWNTNRVAGRPGGRRGRVRGDRRRRPGRPADRAAARRGGPRPRRGRVRADRRRARGDRPARVRGVRRRRAARRRRRGAAPPAGDGRPPPPPRRARARRGGRARRSWACCAGAAIAVGAAARRPRSRGAARRAARRFLDAGPAHAPTRCSIALALWARGDVRRRRGARRWAVAQRAGGARGRVPRRARRARVAGGLARAGGRAGARGGAARSTPCSCSRPGRPRSPAGCSRCGSSRRCCAALARAAERLPVGPYLTLVALARQPGRTAAAVAVVAVAGAAGTFALGHARTLAAGRRSTRPRTGPPADVRGLAPSPGAKPAADDSPVVRIEAEGLGQPLELQLLGVSAQLLPRLPGWREDFSDVPIAQLAERLDGDPKGVRLQGVDDPARRARDPSSRCACPARARCCSSRSSAATGRSAACCPPASVAARPRHARLARARPRARRRRGRVRGHAVQRRERDAAASAQVEPGALTARLRRRQHDAADRLRRLDARHRRHLRPRDDGRRVFEYSIAGIAGYLGIRPLQPSAREPVPVLATPGAADADGNLFARVPGRRADPAADRRPHPPHADRAARRGRGRRRRPPVRRAQHPVPGPGDDLRALAGRRRPAARPRPRAAPGRGRARRPPPTR